MFYQHAHIENIKTVANLTNNKMCSCASFVSMHVLATSKRMRPCSRKLMPIPAQMKFQLTSMQWSPLRLLIVI